MTYTHLTEDERYTQSIRKGEHPRTKLRLPRGRNKGAISREPRRNWALRDDQPHQTERLAKARLKTRRGGKQVTDHTWKVCCQLVESCHGPEQAAGRCNAEGQRRVSHEYLYRRPHADKAEGGHLHQHLRCQKPRRKRYGSSRKRRRRIPGAYWCNRPLLGLASSLVESVRGRRPAEAGGHHPWVV